MSKELFEDWNEVNQVGYKNAIRYNIKQLHQKSLIEVFSNAQILPKYGFPIDIKSLQVLSNPEKFDLSRSSFLALAEYAPQSKILVGGMVVESKGIAKHFTGKNLDEAFGEKGFYYSCSNGHFFTSKYIKVHKCIVDGCNGVVSKPYNYLIPEYGYVTALSDKLEYKNIIPKRVGYPEIYSEVFDSSQAQQFNYENYTIFYKENSAIYSINKGEYGLGFVICNKCGYAESEKYDKKVPSSFLNHTSIYSTNSNRCLDVDNSYNNIWRYHNLSAKILTDAILIVPKNPIPNEKIAQTFANALRLSGAEELGIDERELNAIVQKINNEFAILVYDNQSGGVGYVYDLAKNRWNEWLESSKKRLFIDERHNQECVNGCIKCVVTINTNEPLPRKETLDYLENNLSLNVKEEVKKVKKPTISKEDRFKKFRK